MSESPVAFEWRSRADFAEIAEALSTTTEYIFAVHPMKNILFVYYTPRYGEGDPTIYSAWLRPDQDGILRLDATPEAHPGMWEDMKSGIEDRLKEQFDE